MLKKVRNNAYVAKKLNAVIAAKKHSITAVEKYIAFQEAH
jgi:hypothetical protein